MSSQFYSITKNQLFSLSAAPEKSNLPGLTEENNSYLGANLLEFLCELPVRTRMTFAIHSHLLHSYHITSFVNDTFIIPKWRQSDIFAHKKQKKKRKFRFSFSRNNLQCFSTISNNLRIRKLLKKCL